LFIKPAFWGSFWKNVNRGTYFDAGQYTPALKGALSSLPDGSAFVPGCGRGYDAILLSEGKKRSVTGLDIAEKAVLEAEKYRDEMKIDKKQVQYVCGDFFKHEPSSKQPYDVIFDYTFLCAMPPNLRKPWAETMARLIKPETGRLVTLIFPIGEFSGGPPYAMSYSLVKELLKPHGFTEVSSTDKFISHRGRQGRELLVIWKKDSKSSK